MEKICREADPLELNGCNVLLFMVFQTSCGLAAKLLKLPWAMNFNFLLRAPQKSIELDIH
jgi:hypothetical protein